MDDEARYDHAATELPSPIREEPRPLVLGIVVALAAAAVGGVVWAYIVKSTDYEVGIVAWAIGWIVGTAVVMTMGARRDPALQVVAVAASLAGILLGKYLSFALVVQDEAESLGASVGLFSGDMIDFFRDELDTVFGLFDVLWIGLAAYTAWRLTRPAPPHPEPPGAAV